MQSNKAFIIYFLLGLFLCAFGQPAFHPWAATLAGIVGYAFIFLILLQTESKKGRFLTGFAWFAAVQLIQLSWLPSHPYAYIYGLWFFLAAAMGSQFGMLAILITPERIKTWKGILAISGLWTLFEWARLLPLSGFSFNPVGMALAGNLYSLQMASLAGVFGLSFWVILVNLLGAKTWQSNWKPKNGAIWAIAASIPFLFGAAHLAYQDRKAKKSSDEYKALLIQTAFPVEETLHFKNIQQMMDYTFEEWRQILRLSKKGIEQKIDLLALPELVVPFGTYSPIYPYEKAHAAFQEVFGNGIAEKLPPKEPPFAAKTDKGWMVNNAFWCQGIANIVNTDLIIGLEDAEDMPNGREYYSAAIHFKPREFDPFRYEKRVLVPMGEYIPFSFCRDLAAKYGVSSSFTHGREAKVTLAKVPIGLSICYEETFGHLMRENKQKGARLLLNLTSDVWYPDSRLPRQHLEHARLRTVENGIPLLRACNTGVTCAIDSLGRDVAVLGEGSSDQEWISDSLYVSTPLHEYTTVYSTVGDWLIIGLSFLFVAIGFLL